MKQFKFRKKTISLDFEGKVYEVENSANLTAIFERMGRELSEMKDNTTHSEFYDRLRCYIDELLGEGASEDIFEGREPDMFDCIDVINYIKDAVVEEAETRVNSIASVPPNRIK